MEVFCKNSFINSDSFQLISYCCSVEDQNVSSIQNSSRGPAVVTALFRHEQPLFLEEIEDGFIKNNLNEIRIDNFDCLMDLNINSYGKTQEQLLSLYLLSSIVHTKYHAINQFADGVR